MSYAALPLMSGYKYNKGFFDDFGDGGSVLNQLNYVPAVGETVKLTDGGHCPI